MQERSGRSRLIIWITVIPVVAVLVILAFFYRGQQQPPLSLDDFGEAPSFTLINQEGRTVRSEDLAGKVLVANLIYTSCTHTCPLLTVQMKSVHEALSREDLLPEEVVILSYSVDPDRDTPEVLREYARKFDLDLTGWHFLTGEEADLRRVVVEGFYLSVIMQDSPEHSQENGEADDDHDYLVGHSNRFVLIDRAGHIRSYPDGLKVTPEEIVRMVRALL